jgi:glycosyltransferase involved in cell wall biosynthesis
VDRFVAISEHVRARIRESYGVDADVVYPHVDLDRFPPPDAGAPAGGAFDLIVSALVPYKRLDLAVHAYARCGRPLKIAGTGTEERRLRALAPPNVELLGWRSDEEIAALYRACRLLVFPGEEDFGIVPLEAMACGKPVVALRRGGVTETVRDGETGVFFDEQTEESLLAAVETAGGIAWNARRLRAAAERFGATAFAAGLTRSIERLLAARR